MHLWSASTSSQYTAAQFPEKPADQTYAQFAQILAERHGTYMTQARLKRMCRVAEMKLDDVLQSYSLIRA